MFLKINVNRHSPLQCLLHELMMTSLNDDKCLVFVPIPLLFFVLQQGNDCGCFVHDIWQHLLLLYQHKPKKIIKNSFHKFA